MLDFTTLLVSGIPLVLVVFALVEMVKSFGLKGHILTVVSLLIGLVLGVCYQIAVAGSIAGFTFSEWFAVAIFGLTLGLIASGFYKWADNRFPERQG